MDKLAIFVEGQTEQIFVEKLLLAIAGQQQIHIDMVQAYGGSSRIPRLWIEVDAHRPDPDKRYYVIIYDCMNDERVLSDIREHYDNLIAQGYKDIIGIRDVRPRAPADIPTIRQDFDTFIPKRPIYPILILAIMEIESWFIGEHTHFPRFHPDLTEPRVNAQLGYDPSTCDLETIPSPADDLCSVYGLVNRGYSKDRRQVERTVHHLDYIRFYMDLHGRFADLANLIAHINAFLT
jgi:hypothetical protein